MTRSRKPRELQFYVERILPYEDKPLDDVSIELVQKGFAVIARHLVRFDRSTTGIARNRINLRFLTSLGFVYDKKGRTNPVRGAFTMKYILSVCFSMFIRRSEFIHGEYPKQELKNFFPQ